MFRIAFEGFDGKMRASPTTCPTFQSALNLCRHLAGRIEWEEVTHADCVAHGTWIYYSRNEKQNKRRKISIVSNSIVHEDGSVG